MLQLRPYCREVDPTELAEFAAVHDVPDRERDTAEFALQLARAAADRSNGAAPTGEIVRMRAPSSSATLDDEVAELLELAEWWPRARRFAAGRQGRAGAGADSESNR